MDPNEALAIIIRERQALEQSGDSAEFVEAVDNLFTWLASGGFAPHWSQLREVYD